MTDKMQAHWISDRPLDIEKDYSIFVSRKKDIQNMAALLSREGEIIFVWSPPKSGTTTFFNELRSVLRDEKEWNPFIIDASKIDPNFESQIKKGSTSLLIIDELEDLKTADEIKKAIVSIEQIKQAGLNLIVAGDNRIYEAIKSSEKLRTFQAFELTLPDAAETIQKLIVDIFKQRSCDIDHKAAQTLYQKVGGNLYLIQSLSDAICNRRPSGTIGEEFIVAFMTRAGNNLKEYFDDLVKRVMRDSRAPYAVLALMGGLLKERSNSLKGVGIVGADGQTFSSWLHENICKQFFTPREFAQLFSLEDWEKAIEFYDYHLSNFCQDIDEKRDTLEEASNTAFASKALLKYTSYSNQLSYLLQERGERIIWLEDQFIPRFTELIKIEPEKNYQKIFDALIIGFDTVSRTGRVRLYLTDANEMRLICRSVIGGYEDEFRREPITIESQDSKLAKVYKRSLGFEELYDAMTDIEVNQNIASLGRVNSAWFFNIFKNKESYESSTNKGDCIGTLCVDNPYHKSDPPTDTEKSLIIRLLIKSYPFLLRAREEANRFDLHFRIEKLLSLHQHILTTDPSEEVLDHLFKVAVDLQPNLSMIVVRLVKGCNKERLRLEAVRWWPERLGTVFENSEIKIIAREDSRASKIMKLKKVSGDDKTIFIHNVLNPEEYEAGSALANFINLVKKEKLSLQLGSLLMFTLETEREYLGTCSFYTHTPRYFLEDEVESLALIVKQTAVALYNAQRIEATNRQRKGMEILNGCIAMINQNLNEGASEIKPIDLKWALSEQLGNLFKASSASFVVPDYRRNKIIAECTWTKDEVARKTVDANFAFEMNRGVTGHAIRTGQVYVLSIKDPEWAKEYVERVSDIRTCAAIPMKEGDKVIGAFALESKDEDAFTSEDVQIIEAVVSAVPIAMRNAELLMDLKNRNMDLRKTKDELEEINKKLKESYWMEAMGESVGAVVHSMTHYANPIKSAADVALRCLQKGTNQENISKAIKNVMQLQDYGQALQQFIQKFNQANAVINKERFYLDLLIKEIASKFSRDINIEVRASENQEIITDKFKLHLILECLIDNAYKAVQTAISMDRNRKALVILSLEKIQLNYKINVIDSGMGIPLELQQKLLKHIVQSQSKDGTGSGLFLSQRLATRLNGAIAFTSDLGGSIFSLTIPVVLADEGSND